MYTKNEGLNIIKPKKVVNMRFKSDKQRCAVMAKLAKQHPRADFDRDGVINKQDCQPYNPKKQGFLHNLTIRRLKKQEEHLETKREKEQKKLEDLKDELNARNAVTQKKLSIQQARLKQKQAVINEINKEKQELKRIKTLQKKADKAIFNQTLAGKISNKAKTATKEFKKRWDDPKEVKRRQKNYLKGKKVIKKIGKELGF